MEIEIFEDINTESEYSVIEQYSNYYFPWNNMTKPQYEKYLMGFFMKLMAYIFKCHSPLHYLARSIFSNKMQPCTGMYTHTNIWYIEYVCGWVGWVGDLIIIFWCIFQFHCGFLTSKSMYVFACVYVYVPKSWNKFCDYMNFKEIYVYNF